MNWYNILFAIAIYLIIIGCLCSSINVVPYSGSSNYSSISEGFEALQSSNNFANSLGKSVGESACKKVHGFKELQCSPDQPFSTIDSYGFTQGKPGCNGAGYFNSKGDLCLDEKQLNELHNRGGNDATPSNIGA
tara:strand:- start:575 stop:976 length:402 start_codon:yes stop_codon:yes gene_type:complete